AGHAVRAGLFEALTALAETPGLRAIALYGAGRSFIAGADIREFGQPPRAPSLPEVCNAIEQSAVPVVAILHGVALGGGLEVAMAAQSRVALPGTRLGLPEVTLGILPGAGGTQRAPRLMGLAPARDLILSGKPIGAEAALKAGLIDAVEAGEPRTIALAAAGHLISGTLTARRTCDLPVTLDPDDLAAARAALPAHDLARSKALDALAEAHRPIAKGLATERALFNDCLASPQRAALIHAFFAERAAAKIPEAQAAPRDIGHIGVLGAGTMGSGIATACLIAGLNVTLVERAPEALARGQAQIESNLDGAVKRGKLSAEARAACKLTTSDDIAAMAGADLIIEAIIEDFDAKAQVLSALEAACPGALLASNTSYLDLDGLAGHLRDPGALIGLHFFSPAHVMRLLEVVVGRETRAEAVATGFKLAKRLGKVAVRAGVCDGFIGNRLLRRYRMACDHLVLAGATPTQIDAALEDFGMALGPYRTLDLAGLDIGWADRKRRAPDRDPAERYVTFADRLFEAGELGRKAGRGFYVYDGDEGTPPNPALDALIAADRAAHSVTPRDLSPQEIQDYALTAIITEAAEVLDEGIAARASDIDVVLLMGYGFPRWRGGPLHYADTLGAGALAARIERYADDDAFFWKTPALLAKLSRDGGTFAELG
ncbi:MAG: 3-hydroxyacyl-CoA dehydrogenase NAD-binding domain-containing protein, partial [Pseudomonadota bacterium]